jgi:hypothetical protein
VVIYPGEALALVNIERALRAKAPAGVLLEAPDDAVRVTCPAWDDAMVVLPAGKRFQWLTRECSGWAERV